jgi:outer membrane protein TolC
MRLLSILLALVFLSASPCLAAEDGKIGSFKEYVRLLLAKHPDLKGLDAALEAANQVPDYAYSLENPLVGIGITNATLDSEPFRRSPMTQKRVFASQRFPAFGKRALRKKVAEDDIVIAQLKIRQKQLDLLKEAWIAFAQLDYLTNVENTVLKNVAILKEFVQVALAKYGVGKGLQQNVLQAQVELTNMETILVEVREKLEIVKDALAVMALLPIGTDVTHINAPSPRPLAGEVDELLEQAVSTRPLFKALQTEIERAKHSVELAKRDLLPDYTIGLAYGQRDEFGTGDRSDMVSASLTLSIPAWQKVRQKKKISENISLADKAEQKFNSAKLAVRDRIADLRDKEQKKVELLVLYNQGLLLQASQTVDSALASYEVDKVDFLTLVMNQLALFNFEIKRDRLDFELKSARIRILRALGDVLEEAINNAG